MKFVGVDGCRGGWFAICLDGEEVSFGVFSSFSRLWEVLGDADAILVDMPIGLPSEKRKERQADVLARRYLKGRASSIFSPSVREALHCHSYVDACEANRELIGKKFSKQYWGIAPKILEVDLFLETTADAMDKIKESHPEVCFKAALGASLQFSKRKLEGLEEMLDILDKYINNAREIYDSALESFHRKTVARDDVLDAMVLAVTAHAGQGKLTPMPDPPERDERGLPMAIWYHDFANTERGL